MSFYRTRIKDLDVLVYYNGISAHNHNYVNVVTFVFQI